MVFTQIMETKLPRTYILRSEQIAVRCCEAVMVSHSMEKPIEVLIRPYKEDKTAAQRGWWHMLLRQFGDECGYTMQEMKDLVKKEILGTKIVTVAGRTVETAASSESEDRIGYSSLIESTYRLAAEAGVQLPPPMMRNF